MNPFIEHTTNQTRRQLLFNGQRILGAAALSSLLTNESSAADVLTNANGGLPNVPHFPGKAKRVIYLFMSGGPSHIDLFDFKPEVRKIHGQELPDSIRQGQRITTMTSGQKSFPCVAPMFQFRKHGECGRYVSELLPHMSTLVDDMTVIKSMHTEAINHDPAMTFINTGRQQPGRPCMGAWLSYGLGSPNRNLPAFVVMISRGEGNLQALYSRLWGSGFLPSRHQGVKFRGGAEPVLYLKDPDGIDRNTRRRMLDGLSKLNQAEYDQFADPETLTRIAQYEMAYRMQTAVPELADLRTESAATLDMYGPDVTKPNTFARNCIIARRLAERGVPFIQLYHRGWDQHGNLPRDIRKQCRDVDQPVTGLINDLKQRGMLDETLVVWGGEFGRTIYSQGKLTKDNHGRDHHGRCFTTCLFGGGAKPGIEYGKTDAHCYNILENPVHIRDLNATILHTLGIDHERLTFKYLGLDQRLTGVEPSRVVHEVLS